MDGGPKNSEVTKFSAGGYVLPTYPNCQQVSGYVSVIIAIDRPDLVKVRDLITIKESMVHANRLRPFKHPKNISRELVAADLDEAWLRA